MENESTFVAPEGVYSMTEEHKHTILASTTVNNAQFPYPSRLSSVTVRFPAVKQAPGFAQLLGGGSKDSNKDKNTKDRKDDDISASSSETPDDNHSADPRRTTSKATPDGPGLLAGGSHRVATSCRPLFATSSQFARLIRRLANRPHA